MSAVHSSAQEGERKWTSYWRDSRNVEYYYDKDGIERPSKGLLRVWRRRVFPPGSSQQEIVTLDEIDCDQAKYRTLEIRVTNFAGKTQTLNKVSPWGKIFMGTSEEYLLDGHCK